MNRLRQTTTRLFYTLGKKNVLTYMAELDRLQWLSQDEILALQYKQLQKVLDYAYTYIPYYQDIFKQIGFHPNDFAKEPTALQKIPILTKQTVREQYHRLTTTEPARQNQLTSIKTGGTTGEPLRFMQDSTYRSYNTAHDYHTMTWSGWQVGQPQVWLWGHQPNHSMAATGSRLPQLKDWLINRYTANAYVLTPASMDNLAGLLEKQAADGILWSYVSTMYRFAQFLQKRGHCLKLRALFTAGEPLFDQQRQFIQQVFNCPVFNSYSSIDTGDIACECEKHHGLHIMARNCYVEVWSNSQLLPDDEPGEFVVTSLTNYGMPLIRYKLEDWGQKSSRRCACGRGLPLLEVVEGRKVDLFKTKDGRTVFSTFANKTIATLGGVKQFQVVQKSLELIVFRIVRDGPVDEQRLSYLEQYTKATLGDGVNVKFEFVDNLPLTPAGKHRYLVSEIA